MIPPEVRPDIPIHVSKKPAVMVTVDLSRSKPDTLQRIVHTHGGK